MGVVEFSSARDVGGEALYAAWDLSGRASADEGLRRYSAVEPRDVDWRTRNAARIAVAIASAGLKVAPPRVLWFAPETTEQARYRHAYGHADWPSFRRGGDTGGIANRDAHAIGLRATLSPQDAVETAAHECKHVSQKGDLYFSERGEAEAEAFGVALREKLACRRWKGTPDHYVEVVEAGDLLEADGHPSFYRWKRVDYGDLCLVHGHSSAEVYKNEGRGWPSIPEWRCLIPDVRAMGAAA